MLGGERFYTLARWITLLLLAAITSFLSEGSLWPVSIESPPLVIVLWAYIGFGLLATLLIFIPAVLPLLGYAYVIDLAFISLMTFFGGESTVVFFPLYLLPLINAAVRQTPMMSLGSGVLAASLYSIAVIAWHLVLAQGMTFEAIDGVAMGLRALTLTLVPWVTSGLTERWSASNRASVELARQEAEAALNDARAYRDQMRSLYEVAYTLATTVDYRQVLESTLRESRKLVPFTTGFVLLAGEEADTFAVAASESLDAGDQARQITASAGIAAALRGTEARVVVPTQEPDLASFSTLQRCTRACLVPLRANLRSYGIVVVALDSPGNFTGEQIDHLTTLANYAIIALQNAQLIFDLKEERNKLISKEEVVRHQLARDLHDGPAQALAALTMNIEFIKRLLERDPSRVVEELDKMSALAKRTTYEVRTMLFELRPLVLETQGLKVTLEQYLERFQNNRAGTAIVLEGDEVADVHLETKTEGTLFNIIQEAVNNALKHARAKHIWIRLRREGKNLLAVVQDDGSGFDLQGVLRNYEKRGSFGLLNIDERARLVGGNAELASEPGKGTKVTILVPLEQ
ncbi:MAG: histidine kinase [Candidatus Viridilinea halotolerans]|uniref:Histidine kinase n=1 Tax=Candidatus Viridilinea halotolerans TaxID=2491704 RepID=A0A426TTM3_9CHLR|nr:MAG: histidine kinase [Candidatus Viridilinea halotolerans]